MSKKKSQHLLIPGPEGWELWCGNQCVEQHEVLLASQLPKPPPSPFVMAFAVREATALPLVVPTTDEDLLGELVEMHFERSGVTPDRAAGKLDDHFLVSKGEESSSVLAVVLRVQTEQDLPKKGADGFDLSARCYRPERDGIYLWQEFGRWVFGVYVGAELLYFQVLYQSELDSEVGREIQIALAQLEMQGLIEDGLSVTVWDESADLSELKRGFSHSVQSEPKPAPRLPSVSSELLPADVAAERRQARQRTRYLAVAVVIAAVVIFGTIFLSKDYFELREERGRLASEMEQLAPQSEAAAIVLAKKREIAPLIDYKQWPQQLLLECAKSLPRGRVVRFKKFEVIPADDGRPRQIEIEGQTQSQNYSSIAQFESLLKRNPSLKSYELEKGNDQERNGLWMFTWVLNNKAFAEE